MVIVLSKKLAKDSQVFVCEKAIDDLCFYVHTIEIDNYTLLLLLKKESYFSYATVVNTDEEKWLGNTIKTIFGETDIAYTYNSNASILSKISTIGKKYKHTISLKREKSNIVLEEIEDLINNIPWKFLDFSTPREIEERMQK